MADFAEFGRTLLPLGLAGLLGGLVGFEREVAGRPAGLRTHVLVAIGSALVMQVSLLMFDLVLARGQGQADPGRIAAQVVSGIGFLGAGTILREGLTIRGLTTAASLWVVAGIGLAVGTGRMYLQATAASLLILATLYGLSRLEKRFIRTGEESLVVHVTDTPGRLGAVASAVGQVGANIRSVRLEEGETPGTVAIRLRVHLPWGRRPEELVARLMDIEGVRQVSEEE
ncbi:MgtC/SapB family protein [Caldinitratiruptor microaerophilus]|uniref:Magnesium transporter MgtC n=1 Tax=Caldinitratiruptor microaerophilus TaxID=671077 RepID=A0AA35CI58_9FIRM|nr:MgtC/SapB family protein [Caldinitratiruptor microaerophilus]BDG59392.1 magnesium transporter MgtC [Caldinitratiruptor microaerophilus]